MFEWEQRPAGGRDDFGERSRAFLGFWALASSADLNLLIFLCFAHPAYPVASSMLSDSMLSST